MADEEDGTKQFRLDEEADDAPNVNPEEINWNEHPSGILPRITSALPFFRRAHKPEEMLYLQGKLAAESTCANLPYERGMLSTFLRPASLFASSLASILMYRNAHM